MAMTRLVLVHGAFGGSWCWEPVLPGLRAAGHDAEAIDLPGAGADLTPLAEVTLDAYAERICQVLAEGPPALLVGASMGGIAITQAAARCPQHVAALAYVSAFAPADGQSLMALASMPEAAGDQVQANLVVEGDPPVATLPAKAARHAVYNCATDEQAAWAGERHGPQALAPFAQPFTLDELQDRAIAVAMQRRMLSAAGCVPVIEIDTDHSPWLSRPDETVAALVRIAGELVPA
jgi:pimeloyl-ACP methyl ester carboxylesterase